LAFQIKDDLLDVIGKEKSLGKAVKKDQKAGKQNFVSILGKERAKEQAELLANQAIKHLKSFDQKADILKEVARFIVERNK